LKIKDPLIFLNDGNHTLEDWHTDMDIKLDSDPNRNEKEKTGYVLSRTGGNPCALIQGKHLGGKYSTTEAIIQDLAEAFNDPNKKVKARALCRNLRMAEQEHLKTFLFKPSRDKLRVPPSSNCLYSQG
jgi:hypothetical protein